MLAPYFGNALAWRARLSVLLAVFSGPEAGATLADWQAVSPSSALYDDTGGSSFGRCNVDFDGAIFTQIQDPFALQNLVIPEPSSMGLLSMALLMVAWKGRWRASCS